MRVAVISDVHGNRVALHAALADINERDVDEVVCLGDTVQGGVEPQATIEKLRELRCPIVMGNADAWLLDESDSAEPVTVEQQEVRSWTLSKLSSQDIDFIRGFQTRVEVNLDGALRLVCFHGSPSSYDDILSPDTSAKVWERALAKYRHAITAGGHTHVQQLRRNGEGLFFNPGSIGLAFDHSLSKEDFHTDPWAEYAILSQEKQRIGVEFRRVPYDPEHLVKAIRASGHPQAERLVREYGSKNSLPEK